MCTNEFISNQITYDLVSNVAYLIGVPKRFFTQEDSRFEEQVYKRLDLAKPCRVLRNLCLLRTQILRSYKHINERARQGLYELSNVEYIDATAMMQLERDGASFVKHKNRFAGEHLTEINRLISDRVNNVKPFIPDWFCFDYFKKLVLMPNCDEIQYFHENVSTYPYQTYICLHTDEENASTRATLLTNDYVFCTTVYRYNGEYFSECAALRDVPEDGKELLMQFFQSHKTCMIVDCENVTISKFLHMLRSLGDRIDALAKVIFITGTDSSTAWTEELMMNYKCPVQIHKTNRILGHKSQVDNTLISKCFIEKYENGVNGFLLCSSDSDFAVLFDNIPGADFFVMVERDNVSNLYEAHLDERSIGFTYLDLFYSGDRGSMNRIVLGEVKKLAPTVVFNVNEILEKALYQTCLWGDYNEQQRRAFVQQFIKTAKLVFDDPSGDVRVEFCRPAA